MTRLDVVPAKPSYLPAVDGLRALAVLAVIGFHAELPGLSGGFLGVEVFFVISGYLITRSLLGELCAAKRIELRKFWLRRARRLLPALGVLLLASLAVSLLLAPDTLLETRRDATAAALYVSNWWQLINQRSYFMAVERPPLLLHLWSLSVEEQFYLLWPVMVGLLSRLGRRTLGVVALLGGLASALWMAWLFDPAFEPTRAYLGSDSRASGLLIGGALAALLPGPGSIERAETRGDARGRVIIGALGLIFLVWAVTHAHGHSPWIYRGGLLLVDLASCSLIAGIATQNKLQKLLGAPLWAGLGRRSYGLYLWHWPIFALTRPDFDIALSGVPLLGVRLALTGAVSELCYRFVERPIRQGGLKSFLSGRPVALGTAAALLASTSMPPALATGARLAIAESMALPPLTQADALRTDATTRPTSFTHVDANRFGTAIDPAWPKTLTLISDSVTLDLGDALRDALPGWRVEILGRPALMVKQAVPEFLRARSVGSVVVIGLGYNSLFERDRKNQARWSALWDRGAERLLSDLEACGAKKLVWVTLREPPAKPPPEAGGDQYQRYAWYFPYVNERVRALAERHTELAIADWQAASATPDLTTDLIHLNSLGRVRMAKTIARAVLASPAPH